MSVDLFNFVVVMMVSEKGHCLARKYTKKFGGIAKKISSLEQMRL